MEKKEHRQQNIGGRKKQQHLEHKLSLTEKNRGVVKLERNFKKSVVNKAVN